MADRPSVKSDTLPPQAVLLNEGKLYIKNVLKKYYKKTDALDLTYFDLLINLTLT